jgi:hypothetical protein
MHYTLVSTNKIYKKEKGLEIEFRERLERSSVGDEVRDPRLALPREEPGEDPQADAE